MKKKNNTALYLSLTILALIWLVPIVTVFITSLKSNSDFFSGMGLFDLPEKLQWHNYSDAWSKGHLDRYIRNGLIVTWSEGSHQRVHLFPAGFCAYAPACPSCARDFHLRADRHDAAATGGADPAEYRLFPRPV